MKGAPSVSDVDWPVSHRIVRTIYPPVWLFEDIAGVATVHRRIAGAPAGEAPPA